MQKRQEREIVLETKDGESIGVGIDIAKIVATVDDEEIDEIKSKLKKKDITIDDIKFAINNKLVKIKEKSREQMIKILIERGYTEEQAKIIVNEID